MRPTRRCSHCQVEFQPAPKGPIAEYCSRACVPSSRNQNQAYINAWVNAWRKRPENKEKIDAWRHRRRARIKGNGGWYTPAEKKARFAEFGNACYDCGSSQSLTVGHIIPIALKGPSWIWNIVPQYQRCNSKQGARLHPRATELLVRA